MRFDHKELFTVHFVLRRAEVAGVDSINNEGLIVSSGVSNFPIGGTITLIGNNVIDDSPDIRKEWTIAGESRKSNTIEVLQSNFVRLDLARYCHSHKPNYGLL